jgi:hypothetical protein
MIMSLEFHGGIILMLSEFRRQTVIISNLPRDIEYNDCALVELKRRTLWLDRY